LNHAHSFCNEEHLDNFSWQSFQSQFSQRPSPPSEPWTFVKQPQLLTAVLAQQRFGASLEQVEVLLNLLLVSYQAMKVSDAVWQTITEDMQERCIARLTGGIRFIEGFAEKQVTEAISGSLTDHKEKWLLAYVLDKLGAHGLKNVENETQKYMVLTALSHIAPLASFSAGLCASMGG
jgi:hypothetical protein